MTIFFWIKVQTGMGETSALHKQNNHFGPDKHFKMINLQSQ